MSRALSSRDVRVSNGKVLLHHLFHNPPMTRQEIADATGLSLPTVTGILKNLREKGMVIEGEKLASYGGRPAVHVQPVYDAACSAGIHVKHDQFRMAIADLAMNLLASRTVELPFVNDPSYWKAVSEALEQFLAVHHEEGRRLLGVGIALQSPPDAKTGAIRFHAGRTSETIRTDAVAACFAPREIRFVGEAKMESYVMAWGRKLLRDFVYLSLDDHIGGSIVLNTEVFDYDRPNAEFGHLTLEREGALCCCGRRGCLDAYCSATALREQTGLSVAEFFEKVSAGDRLCLGVYGAWLDRLCQALQNIRLTMCLDIYLGGDIAPHLAPHLEEIRSRLAETDMLGGSETFLHLADCGEYTAAIGAGLVLNDQFLSSVM